MRSRIRRSARPRFGGGAVETFRRARVLNNRAAGARTVVRDAGLFLLRTGQAVPLVGGMPWYPLTALAYTARKPEIADEAHCIDCRCCRRGVCRVAVPRGKPARANQCR